jgi:hypothetical protein
MKNFQWNVYNYSAVLKSLKLTIDYLKIEKLKIIIIIIDLGGCQMM